MRILLTTGYHEKSAAIIKLVRSSSIEVQQIVLSRCCVAQKAKSSHHRAEAGRLQADRVTND